MDPVTRIRGSVHSTQPYAAPMTRRAVFGYVLPPMLHINDLTYRIEGRVIFDKATAGIPAGHKVGFVGRNGSGKTTLLRLIAGRAASRRRRHQRAALDPHRLGDAGGAGRTRQPASSSCSPPTRSARGCSAEAETAHDPGRIADIHERLADIGAHAAPSRAARILAGLGFDEAAQQRPCSEYSGGWRMRVALAAMLFTEPDLLLLDEPTNYLDLEGTLWLEDYLRDYPHTVLIVSHDRELLNRSVGVDPAPGAGQAHALHRRLRPVRGDAAREAAPRPQAQEEAGRRAPPHRGVHHPLQGQGLQGHARRKAASRRWPACSRSPSRSRSAWRRSCSPTRPRRSPAR